MERDAEATPGESATEPSLNSPLVSATFVAAAIAFFASGALVVVADPPPSDAPVLGMLAHGLWALAVSLLAVGALAVVLREDALRRRLSGVLGVGALGLGVVVGVQWVTWAYVDVRAAGSPEYDLALETVITPFGAGHVLMYGVLVGAGVAFLARGLTRERIGHRLVGRAGVGVGVLTVLAASVSILGALEGGGDGHWLYNAATLLLAGCYLWALAFGIDLHRRS